MRKLNRREFVRTSAFAACATLAGTAALGIRADNAKQQAESQGLGAAGKMPVALQVCSVQAEAARDLPGTLRRIAEMGYDGVEFAGFYGHPADEVRGMLCENKLTCLGSHLSLQNLLGDEFVGTAAFFRTVGARNLVVSGGTDRVLAEDGGNLFAAYLFGELARKARAEGMRVGYHSHAPEFEHLDGSATGTAWNLFFNRTDPDVIAQLDIGNCIDSSADPYLELEKLPGRGQLVHLKAAPAGTILGEPGDVVDWQRIFRLCETVSGTEWYIIEQEGQEMDSLKASALALDNYRRIIGARS